MVDPINLNKARKAKAKIQDKAQAAQNRAAFGRPKVERSLAERLEAKAVRELDGKKRDS